MAKNTIDRVLDIAVIGGAAFIGWTIYKKITEKTESPQSIAETSAAKSDYQTRTNLDGSTTQTPYVEAITSPLTNKEVVTISKDAPFPEGSNLEGGGLAVTSMTQEDYADLSFNDRRALERGWFSVTEEGVLITGWDRLFSLFGEKPEFLNPKYDQTEPAVITPATQTAEDYKKMSSQISIPQSVEPLNYTPIEPLNYTPVNNTLSSSSSSSKSKTVTTNTESVKITVSQPARDSSGQTAWDRRIAENKLKASGG